MISTILVLSASVLAIIHVYLVPLQNLPRTLQLEWERWRLRHRLDAIRREEHEHLAAIKEERMRAFRAQVPPKEEDDL